MKIKLLLLLFTLLASNSWAQIPELIKAGDSLILTIDTSFYNGDTTYYITKGWLSKGKKNGVWQQSYKVGTNGQARLRQVSDYKKNRILSLIHYSQDSYLITYYSRNGNLRMQSKFTNDDRLIVQDVYSGPNKRECSIYHPNGNLIAQGPQRRVRITMGCDTGMIVFESYGQWAYYDESANLIEFKEKEINERIFEIL